MPFFIVVQFYMAEAMKYPYIALALLTGSKCLQLPPEVDFQRYVLELSKLLCFIL
jgi:hypothetical protein